jgi:hypothetical protein
MKKQNLFEVFYFFDQHEFEKLKQQKLLQTYFLMIKMLL